MVVEATALFLCGNDEQYFAYPGVADLWEQPNCNVWGNLVMCPTGEIAVGVRMHHDTWGPQSDAFIGIELECAEVVWN